MRVCFFNFKQFFFKMIFLSNFLQVHPCIFCFIFTHWISCVCRFLSQFFAFFSYKFNPLHINKGDVGGIKSHHQVIWFRDARKPKYMNLIKGLKGKDLIWLGKVLALRTHLVWGKFFCVIVTWFKDFVVS